MLYWPGEGGGAFLRFWGESGELKGKAETEQVLRSVSIQRLALLG